MNSIDSLYSFLICLLAGCVFAILSSRDLAEACQRERQRETGASGVGTAAAQDPHTTGGQRGCIASQSCVDRPSLHFLASSARAQLAPCSRHADGGPPPRVSTGTGTGHQMYTTRNDHRSTLPSSSLACAAHASLALAVRRRPDRCPCVLAPRWSARPTDGTGLRHAPNEGRTRSACASLMCVCVLCHPTRSSCCILLVVLGNAVCLTDLRPTARLSSPVHTATSNDTRIRTKHTDHKQRQRVDREP
jgi:hypothetical protein